MCFFFFQAEDGIRDLVRSRGLGDVYKRQEMYGIAFRGNDDLRPILLYEGFKGHPLRKDYPKPVSYTHLTLPTSDLV